MRIMDRCSSSICCWCVRDEEKNDVQNEGKKLLAEPCAGNSYWTTRNMFQCENVFEVAVKVNFILLQKEGCKR